MTALLLSNETTSTLQHRHDEASILLSLTGNGETEKEAIDEDENDPYIIAHQHRSVFFRYMDGRTYCLWLDPNLTVLQVKLMLVNHVEKCNNNNMMLLSSCENKCTRLSSLLETSKQSIDAKETTTLCSTTASSSTTTLATTTRRSAAATSALDLCMVLQGKPLEDDVVLSHCIPQHQGKNNNNNSNMPLTTIVVFQRQRGGCFMVSLSILVIIFFALLSSCCTCGLSLLVVPVLLPLLFILPLFCL